MSVYDAFAVTACTDRSLMRTAGATSPAAQCLCAAARHAARMANAVAAGAHTIHMITRHGVVAEVQGRPRRATPHTF